MRIDRFMGLPSNPRVRLIMAYSEDTYTAVLIGCSQSVLIAASPGPPKEAGVRCFPDLRCREVRESSRSASQ